MKQNPTPTPGRVNCRNCGGLNVRGCPECKRCIDRCGCRCRTCEACSAKSGPSKEVRHSTSARCKNCGKCRRGMFQATNSWGLMEDFCACRKMPKWMFIRDPKATERSINRLSRPLGLEIELCNIGTFGQGDWKNRPPYLAINFEHDGSVRGAATEAVLNPLIGDQFLEGIVWLTKYLVGCGAEVDTSCGLHVHVGASDFGPYELRRLFGIYQSIQHDIYGKMIPAYRQEPSPVNGKYYCMPYDMDRKWWAGLWEVKDPSALREYICSWVFRHCKMDGYVVTRDGKEVRKPFVGVPNLRRGKYQIPSRYYGLNIHSWFVRGTIEWRHYPGTLALDEILYWPLLCGWITQLASALTDQEVQKLGGMEDLVTRHWQHRYLAIRIPAPVRDWTLGQLKKERN